MKKIVRITESDLINIVRRVIKEEEEYNFDKLSSELLSKYFTEKQGFEYIGNNGDNEIYILKKRGFSLQVTLIPSDEPSKVRMMIHINLPMGKKINYLMEVVDKPSITVSVDDYRTIYKYLHGALNFGRAQFDYDTLEPLPKF